MTKWYASSLVLAVVCGFGIHTGLSAWVIEFIKNDLPYTIHIEFYKQDDIDSAISLDIPSGMLVPFGRSCPFAPDFKAGFVDFESLASVFSVAPLSKPEDKTFIAEGNFLPLGMPATTCFHAGLAHPSYYIMGYTLGLFHRLPDSFNLYATLLVTELSSCGKKGVMRKKVRLDLTDHKVMPLKELVKKDVELMVVNSAKLPHQERLKLVIRCRERKETPQWRSLKSL